MKMTVKAICSIFCVLLALCLFAGCAAQSAVSETTAEPDGSEGFNAYVQAMGVTVPHSRMISPQAAKTKIIHLKILTAVGQDFLQGCGFIPCRFRCRPLVFRLTPASSQSSA